MNRKTFLTAALALLGTTIATTAFAQAIPATVDKPVTITFYNYNLASAGIGADGTKKLLAEFMAANPDIIVDGIGVPSPDMSSRIQADVAAGQGPDLAQVVFDSLDFIASNMGASALEDIIPTDELAAHFEGMSPNGLKLGVLDGKTYALAYTFSTPVLFYNADLFRAAGLDPDKPPRNWAEVKQAALTIEEKTDAAGFATGAVGAAASGFDWLLQGVILSNGGRVMSEDRTRLTFAEPAAVGAVEMLRDLHDSGVFENNASGSDLETMNAGALGMFLNTSAYQRSLIAGAEGRYDLRAAPMPGFGDKLAVPTNSGSGLVILSADPLKQRAAWELMKFLTSKRGYTIITSEIGYLPLRTDIVEDPAYLKDWVEEHPLVKPNLAQLDRLQPWTPFPGPNYRQILKTMMDGMEQAVFGGGDVAQTLATAQDDAQSLMP
ncbi:MAG: ABC transporter substrate-binding protein [Devosia sp.]